MMRRIFFILSALSFLLCVLWIALWIGSGWCTVYVMKSGDGEIVSLAARQDGCSFTAICCPAIDPDVSFILEPQASNAYLRPLGLGFAYEPPQRPRQGAMTRGVTVPYLCAGRAYNDPSGALFWLVAAKTKTSIGPLPLLRR